MNEHEQCPACGNTLFSPGRCICGYLPAYHMGQPVDARENRRSAAPVTPQPTPEGQDSAPDAQALWEAVEAAGTHLRVCLANLKAALEGRGV